jgi:hypothetical protein
VKLDVLRPDGQVAHDGRSARKRSLSL